jgi:hypothetical protein
MMLLQPKDVALAGATVIPFAGQISRTGLSLRDRMEVASWQGRLQPFGCDRMVIHERGPCDPPDLDSFLSIYRKGEAWARWGLARCGSSVLAWCSVTGADIGRFASVGDALGALFPASPNAAPGRPSAQIIAFC